MVLGRFLSKRNLRRKRTGFHSPFGGLWTDRVDAGERLERKLAEGRITPEEAERLSSWIANGFAVLPGAVPHDRIDAVNAAVDGAWERLDPNVEIEIGGVHHQLTPSLRSERAKVLDMYVHSRDVLRAAFSASVSAFLRLIFERDVLLFQSLNFERGSGQPMHQDTAYVVVGSPLELAAAWIALEDWQPGSGELCYYPGSHRMREFLFRGGYRNWNSKRDGDELHARFLASVHERAHERGLEVARFRPKKGDVFLWNADLAHGGSEITDPRATRKSLVCHYCPADVRPYYFTYQPRRRTLGSFAPGNLYCSSYYPLTDA